MQITFSGNAEPRAAEDLKRLYLHRAPFYPTFYLAVAVAALAFGGWESTKSGPQGLALWLFIAAAAIYLALFAPKVAYGRWARVLQGLNLAGTVSEEGVQLDGQPLLPWRSFLAARICDRAAILYVSKADGVPLHRELFDSDLSWQQARQLASERVRRVYTVAS